MANETVNSYDFAEDAMGFGQFINDTFADNLSDEEIVVYVEDAQGNSAKSARFVRQTLTDGSTVVNLIIEFDRP